MASPGYIEAWLYTTGSKTAFEATTTLTCDEGGAVPGDAILAAPSVFSDALTNWAALLNAGGGANTYALTWDSDAGAVDVTGTGAPAVNFTLDFTGNLHSAFGFSAATGHSGAAQYTGDQQALGRFDLLGVGRNGPRDGADVDLREYRHGRHESMVFGELDVWDLELWMLLDMAELLTESYCAAGRVRVYQDGDTLTAYSTSNVDGYLDGYVLATPEVTTRGPGERVAIVRMTLGVPR